MANRKSQITQTMADEWIDRFKQHLSALGAASYTVRNSMRALHEFELFQWQGKEQRLPLPWRELQRDDFRAYLVHLYRLDLNCGSIQLRFSVCRLTGLNFNAIIFALTSVTLAGPALTTTA